VAGRYVIEVHGIKRRGRKKAKWKHKILPLKARSRGVAEQWASRLMGLINDGR